MKRLLNALLLLGGLALHFLDVTAGLLDGFAQTSELIGCGLDESFQGAGRFGNSCLHGVFQHLAALFLNLLDGFLHRILEQLGLLFGIFLQACCVS